MPRQGLELGTCWSCIMCYPRDLVVHTVRTVLFSESHAALVEKEGGGSRMQFSTSKGSANPAVCN